VKKLLLEEAEIIFSGYLNSSLLAVVEFVEFEFSVRIIL